MLRANHPFTEPPNLSSDYVPGHEEQAMMPRWLKQWWHTPNRVTADAQRTVELPKVGTVTVACSVDCIGAACPRPQLLMTKVLEQAQDGDVIEMVSDNPASVETIPSLALVLYSSYLGTLREEGYWCVYLRKGM